MSTTSSSTDFFKEQLDEAYFRIAGLEEELADKRKQIKRLEREFAKYQREGVEQGAVERVFARWVNATGKNANRVVLTADRRKIINTAIKQRTESVCNKIIDQGAKTPFLVFGNFKPTGSPDSRRDDIADWLGKGKYAEQLLDLADREPDSPLTEDQMSEWHDRLFSSEAVCQRIYALKGWESETLEDLGIGFDGERLIFPVRDAEGTLTAAIRYFPGDRNKGVPKAIAIGPRGLFPAPESVDSELIWLVEGEPDAITAKEMWLPAVGVPGASVSPGDWMKRLSGKRVVICFDCDPAGRQAANRIARPLTQYAAEVKIIDLDPARADGYDLTDWFRQGRTRKTLEDLVAKAKPVTQVSAPTLLPQQSFHTDSASADTRFDRFIRALEAKDCDPKERGGQWTARCPAHEDRVPTLHFTRGRSCPVAAHCKAGCNWEAISEALGHPTRGKE